MTDTLILAQAQGRTTLPGNETPIAVPSGQGVTLQEVILDAALPEAATYRFRYLTPAIARKGGTIDFEGSIADMQHLCKTDALPHLIAPVSAATQVIIAFSDMKLPFGETNPDATQFFMAFTVENGECVLEPY